LHSRKRRDAELKAAVALEALKGGKTLKEVAAEHGVHPMQVSAWRRAFRSGLERIFSGKRGGNGSEELGRLRAKMASLQSEHEWMRNKLAGLDKDTRLSLLEPERADLSLRRQTRLLGINRSSLYYRKKEERPENEELMARIIEIARRFPDFGVLRMTKALREQGSKVNPKRVRRLMRKLSLCLVLIPSIHWALVLRCFPHTVKLWETRNGKILAQKIGSACFRRGKSAPYDGKRRGRIAGKERAGWAGRPAGGYSLAANSSILAGMAVRGRM
jgi:putative transposase